ncbi:hypothetical protein [Halovulum sp. GXIMD14793]
MTTKFEADIARFVKLTKEKINYVAVQSIQDVVEAAQTPQPGVKRTGGSFVEGKIPVDTAALINSLSAGIGGALGAKGADSYVTALAGFEIGDTITFAWTQPYALRIEKGFTGTDKLGRSYNVRGRHFVMKNAARFSTFVEARAREVS